MHVVVGGELREFLEQVTEASWFRGSRVLRVKGKARSTSEGEGNHGDSPTSKSDSGEVLTLCVEECDKSRRDIPVAAQVEVLDGIHSEILKAVETKTGSKEVQANHGPVNVASGLISSIISVGEGLIEMLTETDTEVDPVYKEAKHGGRLTGQPQGDGPRRVGGVIEALGKEGRGCAEELLVDLEALLLGTNEYGCHWLGRRL